MVRINNTFEFEVYSWDTLRSVAERLSANDNMNTIPKYLYLPDVEKPMTIAELRKIDEIHVEDFLNYLRIQKSVSNLKTIVSSLDRDKFLLKEHIDIMVDIVAPFIAYNNTIITATPQVRDALLLALQYTMPNVPSNMLWINREETIRKINEAIQNNKDKVEESHRLLSVKGLDHTDFIRQEVSLHLEFDLQGFTLLEVFDAIKLNPLVPFASANNLYKILRDFTPDPNWGSMYNSIYLQFLSTPPSEQPEFIDAVMVISDEPGKEKGILETGSIKYKYGMTTDVFRRNLVNILYPRLPLRDIKTDIIREKGRFYYNLGSQPLDAYVLGDLALNNPLFKQYIAIDEHEAATKGKRSSTYIHFFGNGGDKQTVRANITVYQVRAKDEAHRVYGYKIDDYYLNVLISNVKSQTDLENFTVIFGKLLTLYYMEADKVIRVYQSLLEKGTFPPKYQARKAAARGKKTKKTLKEQAPEVFVSGYPTKCGNQPRIISAEEAKNTDNIVMQYPKTATEGFPQRWYVCDQDEIAGCTDPNACNFDTNATDDDESCYFYDIPLVSGVTTQQNILTRDAFTDPPKVAVLPDQLEEMLNLVTYQEGWRFVRQGVFDSKSSFLECVLEALQYLSDDIAESLEYSAPKTQAANDVFNKAKSNKAKRDVLTAAEAELWRAKKEERINFLNNKRNELATMNNAPGCKQEMYDYTSAEIMQTIRDPDVYFDPHLLTNLVEKHFGCKIILFSRVSPGAQEQTYESKLNTMLTLPRHIQAYYKTESSSPTILIYERLGRGTEQKEYPRCELITYWDGGHIAIPAHDKDSRVSREMDILYERVRESYNLNCLIPQTVIPLRFLVKFGVKFTHQQIDSYGKCRALIFEYGGERGTLLVTPIQPFLLPRFDGPVTPRLAYQSVVRLLRDTNVVPDRKTITQGQVSAYSGTIGNTRFSIPFIPEKENEMSRDLAIETNLVSNDQVSSKLSSYTQDKRIARYMVEYIRWLYSNFLHDQDTEDSTESFLEFIKLTIVVDEEFRYGPIAKTFSMDSGITNEGRLYVHSVETKKRLIYTLQLFALQHPEELKTYRTRTTISNYYMNVGDFTRYRSQVILQGDDAVSKWINERERDYDLYDEVVTSKEMLSLEEEMAKLSSKIRNLKMLGKKKEDLRERLEERLEDLETEFIQMYDLSLSIPRFFKNPLISDGQMYLYQQTSGLPQALRICDEWNNERINDGRVLNDDEDDSVPEQDFTLYSYRNPTNITAYVCDQGCVKGEGEGATLLGYKNNNFDSTFISLLPLGDCNQ